MNLPFRHVNETNQNINWRIVCGLYFVLIAPVASAAQPQEADSVQPFAVHIERTPAQPWPGYGIYLGDGYVITAAHVAGPAEQTRPRVVVDGRSLTTRVVKQGTFETNDLTLLRVDRADLPGRLQFRRLPLCPAPPKPDQPVLVAIPEGVAPSHILAPSRLPADMRARFPTVIADVLTTGNSGSGVFDAVKGCLLGVMSRKIETVSRTPGAGFGTHMPIAKYFVPVSVISPFLASAPPG